MKRTSQEPVLEFEGLGTHWTVELLDTAKPLPRDLAHRLHDAVTLFDDTYSRFKSSSLVGQLNANGILERPPQELLDMFAFAHTMYEKTDGTFDISVGAMLQAAGYGATVQKSRHTKTFWKEVEYNSRRISLPPETAIDLGGLGKGWLLDRLALLLERTGYPYYLIDAGGDIVISAVQPTSLELRHPYDETIAIDKTTLKRGSLAISSTTKRRWVHGGKTYHPVIDPLTKRPSANGVVAVYVKGQTGLIADTLATVLLLRPDAKEQIEKTFDIKARIVREDQL